MTQARKVVVVADEVGVYHCISRCVRRAFLCGEDVYTGRNYAHRRAWVRERVQHLSALFGIEVFAYSVMSNHLHLVLRNRPDRVAQWSDHEVAERWCRVCPGKAALERGELFDANKLKVLLNDAAMLEVVRQRLSDLSWFMRCLNEFLARRANCEDGCKGRFWEGRFRCQRLMDTGAMLACMAYVDLNPVRAQIADGLEDSQFTSVYDRVMAQRARVRLKAVESISDPTLEQQRQIEREVSRQSEADWLLDFSDASSPFTDVDVEYYLSLVEWTGRTIRADKPGSIPVELERVLDCFGIDARHWASNVRSYGSLFYRIAGKVEQLLGYAQRRGQEWFCGQPGSERLYGARMQA